MMRKTILLSFVLLPLILSTALQAAAGELRERSIFPLAPPALPAQDPVERPSGATILLLGIPRSLTGDLRFLVLECGHDGFKIGRADRLMDRRTTAVQGRAAGPAGERTGGVGRILIEIHKIRPKAGVGGNQAALHQGGRGAGEIILVGK